ncbi:LysR family transcriptional regulator [Streptomyces sp. TRM S81-3]|uniref:LysR family transcriptional regulator n=1 Tax=Streptomyces griseicoloratus TaxID=2752516 RepID=A0A926QS16_9ACTN|nr:LysR family transcriptional regulator [Streptomyces griseicoloratus]MBD0421943.1 LysR family transcriptional regulator [Streptomyces griseicoloratus]
MDTRLLTTFTTLARTGGFTAAAAELHLAQSTVTVHIRTLERDLGVRLFDRLPTGARLTEAGRRLLEGAEDVLDAVARLRAGCAEDGAVSGRVVVGTPESLCATRLPAVIAGLRTSHPEVDVHLHAAGPAECVEGLRSGRLDLALMWEEEREYPDLTTEPVAREALVLVCAPGHPLAAADHEVTWEELAAESFFLLEEGCSYSDAFARGLLAVPGARPRLTRFGSVDAVRSCVAAGLGLTLLPRTTVAEQLVRGRLAEAGGPPFPDVSVRLARHRRRWAAPAVREFARELVRHWGA